MKSFSGSSLETAGATSFRPGPDLVAAIARGENAGRAVWPLAELRVPRLKRGLYTAAGGGYALTTTTEERTNDDRNGREFLHPSLAMMLDHPSIESTQSLFKQANPVAQARYLAAAVLHDVHGWPLGATAGRPFSENIAYHFDYGAGGSKDAGVRAARNAVYGGRVMWARLSAWPWWALGHSRPRGKPLAQWLQTCLPDDWWTLPHVVANFQAWQDPDAFLARQAAARARQQHQRHAA